MVVFPSWLPFFLTQSSRKDKTQRTQSPQNAKKQNAEKNARNDKNTQNYTFILPISPKWVPPVDRMIFILPTCILTGREALAGWVDRKKDAKNCMFKNAQNKVQRL